MCVCLLPHTTTHHRSIFNRIVADKLERMKGQNGGITKNDSGYRIIFFFMFLIYISFTVFWTEIISILIAQLETMDARTCTKWLWEIDYTFSVCKENELWSAQWELCWIELASIKARVVETQKTLHMTMVFGVAENTYIYACRPREVECEWYSSALMIHVAIASSMCLHD